MVVIDPSNLVQNTISALKMIESVINEATMIANQLEQIRVLIQNTTNYPEGIWDREALPRLLRLGRIIEQEQALAYTMTNVDTVFRQRYPGYRPATDWAQEYDTWTRTTLDTLRGTLNAVRLHGEDFAGEQARIDSLIAQSDSAVGRMQAVQAGNMLAAEQVQQLVKLRQLMMAQVNAQNVYMATQADKDARRAATQSQWIRNGNTEAPALEMTAPARATLPSP
jgi:P-type conjugative transfer protein TrbJ